LVWLLEPNVGHGYDRAMDQVRSGEGNVRENLCGLELVMEEGDHETRDLPWALFYNFCLLLRPPAACKLTKTHAPSSTHERIHRTCSTTLQWPRKAQATTWTTQATLDPARRRQISSVAIRRVAGILGSPTCTVAWTMTVKTTSRATTCAAGWTMTSNFWSRLSSTDRWRTWQRSTN
jgi:hypothetical protein